MNVSKRTILIIILLSFFLGIFPKWNYLYYFADEITTYSIWDLILDAVLWLFKLFSIYFFLFMIIKKKFDLKSTVFICLTFTLLLLRVIIETFFVVSIGLPPIVKYYRTNLFTKECVLVTDWVEEEYPWYSKPGCDEDKKNSARQIDLVHMD